MLAAVWIVVAGLSMFMLFFSYDHLTSAYAMLLEIGWVGAFLWSIFETVGLWRERQVARSRKGQDLEHERQVRALMQRRRRR